MTGLEFARVPAERAETYRRDGWWRPEQLDAVVLRTARTRPDRCALVAGDRRLTYGELAAAVDAAARRLRRLGVRHGDPVLVQLPNGIEFVVLLLALLRAGAPAVLATHGLREHELRPILARTRPVAMAVPRRSRRFDHLAMAKALQAESGSVRLLLVAGDGDGEPGTVDLGELCGPPGEPLPPPDGAGPSDAALLLLSSGSTGPPKLMVRTHEDYGYVLRATSEVAAVDENTVYLAVLPMSHSFVLAYPGVLGTLAAGGRVVLDAADDPAHALRLVEREGVTHCAAVPALVTQWLAVGGRGPSVLQVGGAKLDETTAKAAMAKLGSRVQQVYGMSEGLTNYTRLDDPEEVVIGTQGRPASPGDEILIVGEDGRPVPDGETGELLTRGPFTVAGYYRDLAATARSFADGGFYRTGDLVRRHPGGNLVVVGRIKNVINRGGEKICAEDLEDVVVRDTRVAAAVAVPVPHPAYGESVCLFVVPAGDEPVTLRAVRQFLQASGLARYKLPERLEVLAALPLRGVGKVDREVLRARAKELTHG